MTASSYYNYDGDYRPYNARLNKRWGEGGWAAKTKGRPRTDWLQVDMATIQSVCGVATQGIAKRPAWTTSYVLQMSKDETTWNPYEENNTEKVSKGSWTSAVLFLDCSLPFYSLNANWRESDSLRSMAVLVGRAKWYRTGEGRETARTWAVFIFLAASPLSSAPDKTAMPCGLGKWQHFTANPCQNQPKSPILSKGQNFKFVPLLYKVPRGHVIKK